MASSLVTRVIAVVLLFFIGYFVATGSGLSDEAATLTAAVLAFVLVLFWGPISGALDTADEVGVWLDWIRLPLKALSALFRSFR